MEINMPEKESVETDVCLTDAPDDIQDIIEQSGYADGIEFEDEGQVRDYFTCEVMVELFREPCEWTQAQLDRAANWAIEHHYHMTGAK
jgi:hypothetical protein